MSQGTDGKSIMKKFIEAPEEAFVLINETACKRVPCVICDGIGNVGIKHKRFVCPQCGGAGSKMEYGDAKWTVYGPATFKNYCITMDKGEAVERFGYMVTFTNLYGSSDIQRSFEAKDVFESFDAATREAELRNYGSLIVAPPFKKGVATW